MVIPGCYTGEQIMKLPTLLLGAAIVLGGALSGNAMAHGDHGRGWGDYGRHGHYVERHHRGRHHHRHHHKYDRHYVYVPRPHRHWVAPRHYSDGWYGIQLFLGGDL
jgi:hypothetical protein